MGNCSRSAIALTTFVIALWSLALVAIATTAPGAAAQSTATQPLATVPLATPSPAVAPSASVPNAISSTPARRPASIAPVAAHGDSRVRSIDHYLYGQPPIPANTHPAAATAASAPPAQPEAAPAAAALATPASTPAAVATEVAAIPTPAATGTPRAADAVAIPAGPAPKPAPPVQNSHSQDSHSIDHFFYGRPPSAASATPAALATPVAAAAPPTAIAAILPPSPNKPAAAPQPRPSPSAVPADHEADGMRLYLSDLYSARVNPLNWSVTAIKSRFQIKVFYKGRPFKTFHAVFGRSRFGGPKQFEGDRRTPEGNYLIVSKHRSRRFQWFLKINYPNAVDRENFERMRADGDIPRSMREGNNVGIHGTDVPILNVGDINWTTGCISIDNPAISELARLLPIGTLVVIKP
jgi:L,D-transpeptidase catalytic domain